MVIVAGDSQAGVVGTELSIPLEIRITDARGRAVIGQPVSFVVGAGGSVSPSAVLTDALGEAQFGWVLGPSAGSQSLEVGVGDSAELAPSVTFDATAAAGPPSRLVRLAGDSQTAQAGTALQDSLVVEVTDQYGNPIAGLDVAWGADAGTLAPGTTQTSGRGRAAARWTLGSTPGVQHAFASAPPALPDTLSFTAAATAGAPPKLVLLTQPSAVAPTGVPFPQQPVIQLEDPAGQPIAQAGVPVAAAIASGGGVLGGATSQLTDASGQAGFTNLSISGPAGPRTLIFASSGYVAITSQTIVITASSPSPTRSTVVAAPSTIAVGGAQTIITVTALDAQGNPVAGAAVVLSATGGGNTLTQPASPTDLNGVATGTLSSTVTGSKTISATAAGVALTQTASVTVTVGPPAPQTTDANVPGGKRLRSTDITIVTRDAFGNPLTSGGFAAALAVTVSGANFATPTVQDNGDGTYTASYIPLFKGNDDVDITLNGTPINGSPYQSKVK